MSSCSEFGLKTTWSKNKEEELLRVPLFYNLQEIETNTVFSDCI